MVTDLTPTVQQVGLAAWNFVELNGISYFEGDEPNCGKELWRTDGTSVGTWRVTDLAPGADGCDIGDTLIACDGFLYFVAGTSSAGVDQIYRSDGTAKGTFPLLPKENTVNVGQFYISEPGDLYIIGSRNISDYALWKYHPSDSSLEKICSTEQYAHFIGSNSHYTYIQNGNSSMGNTIIRSGGTTSSTFELQAPDFIKSALVIEDALWYQNNSGLWRQGNDELSPTCVLSTAAEPGAVRMFSQNDVVYAFQITSDQELTLWEMTNLGAGNQRLAVFSRGREDTLDFPQFILKSPDDQDLYFSVAIGGNTFQIWRSDNSLSHLSMLYEISEDMFYRNSCAMVNGTFFICSRNGELCKITGAGSEPEIVTGFAPESYIDMLSVADSQLYFSPENDASLNLWKSDGTTSGTNEVTKVPVPESTGPDHLLSVDNHWFFLTADEFGYSRWWCTSGIAEETFKLPSGIVNTPAYTVLKKVFFYASVTESGITEIWRSDGTPQGSGFFATPNYPDISALYSTDEAIYYTCFDSQSQIYSLWKLGKDGISYHLYDFSSGYSPARSMGFIGSKLYLLLRNQNRSDDIFVTDGTSSGTKLIKSLPARSIPLEFPNASCICNDRLYVEAYDQVNGWKLWTTDGTMDAMDAISISQNYIGGLMTLGNKVFFPVAGKGIWSSDGTENGTGPIDQNGEIPGIFDHSIFHLGRNSTSLFYRMLGDSESYLLSITETPSGLKASQLNILPQYPQSPNPVIEFQQGCFLNSYQSFTGEELWAVKEGTSHPQLVQDIWPNGSGSPEQITPGPNGVLFTANDGIHGREIWHAPYSKIWPTAAGDWELYE